MTGKCSLCGEPAQFEIGAKASPSWGTVCETVQIFACADHFQRAWQQVDQDYTVAEPRLITEKRRRIRSVPAAFFGSEQ